MIDFVVIGGGCYGSYYVRQLHAARERGKLPWLSTVVLDRDPECAAGRLGIPGVRVEVCQWETFGAEIHANRELFEEASLVPAPIAPHIAKHWIESVLAAHGRVTQDVAWPGEPPELPFASILERGTLVLSHAPGMCPVNCIEPRKCPLTRQTRTWDMPDTVLALDAKIDRIFTFVCRHYAYGVGVIPMREIIEGLDGALTLDECIFGVATVSGCHGLVDALRLMS